MSRSSREQTLALSEIPTLSLNDSLFPETVAAHTGPARQSALFPRLIGATLASEIAIGIVIFAQAGEITPMVLTNLACIVGTLASVMLLRVIGRTPASVMSLCIGVLSLMGLAWQQGGVTSPVMAFAAFPAWVASFLLRPGWSLIFAALMAFATTAMFGAEIAIDPAGLYPALTADRLQSLTAVLFAIILGSVLGTIQARERQSAEADLVRATDRARAMLNALPDTFVLLTPQGEIIEARVPQNSALGGLRRLMNHRLHIMLDPQEATRLQAAIEHVIHTGTPVTVELRMLLAGVVLDIETRISGHPEGNLVALLRDISAQKRSRRIKDEFVSTVSHELRTPLTSIHGSLALLRGNALGALSPEASGVVELAWRNSDRLRRLIDDLLDVQKMESGRLDLRLGHFHVNELLSGAVDANRVYAAQYGIAIDYKPTDPDLRVRVDDDRFHQVVSNLLSNAIKYSPEAGTVTVCTDVEPHHVRINVIDRGAGIPIDFRPRVFETFAQADSSETRQAGGTGLGLSICKRLVTAFGGEIGFETVEGQGTEFWFLLPRVTSAD